MIYKILKKRIITASFDSVLYIYKYSVRDIYDEYFNIPFFHDMYNNKFTYNTRYPLIVYLYFSINLSLEQNNNIKYIQDEFDYIIKRNINECYKSNKLGFSRDLTESTICFKLNKFKL